MTERLEPLIDAQIDNAIGIRHLMMRDPKTGKFERVTGDVEQIDEALKNNACWIYTKDPRIRAFTVQSRTGHHTPARIIAPRLIHFATQKPVLLPVVVRLLAK